MLKFELGNYDAPIAKYELASHTDLLAHSHYFVPVKISEPRVSGRLPFIVLCIHLLAWLGNMDVFEPSFRSCAWAAEKSGLRIETVNFAPYSRVRPGRVLVIRALVANDGESPAEGQLVSRIEQLADEEGARKIKLAPREVKYFDIYLQVPRSAQPGNYLVITTTLTVMEGGRQVMLDSNDSSMFQTLRLQVEPETVVTAALLDAPPPEYPNWDWKKPGVYDAYEMIVAARLDAEMSRRCVVLDSEMVPCQLVDWDNIDCLVIADDTRLGDAATVEAIKMWLHAGGRLWIMLDRVRCESIRGFLDHGQLCEEVDTVELNEFTVRTDSLFSMSEGDRKVVLTEPVKFKRVLQQGALVANSVDDWPLTMWMSVGHGEVLLTTLAARAWLQPRNLPNSKKGPTYDGAYRLAQWSGNLASRFHDPRPVLPLENNAVEYPLKHIGNPVLAKPIVMSALAAFCFLLVVVGLWRYSSGTLNQIGWLAPLLAMAGAVPLLLAAAWVRKDIPDSLSRLQFVEATYNGENMLVREQSAVYLRSPVSTHIAPQSDAKPNLVSDIASSGMRRWNWDDYQKWQLSNSAWPAGLWRFDQTYSLPSQSMMALGTLGSEGVSLELPSGLASLLEDSVLSFVPNDPVACGSQSSGPLKVGDSESIVGDKWIGGTLMSDEQVRRIAVYQQVFKERDRRRNWDYPVLYGWTQIWPGGPDWRHEFSERGSALVAIPVKLSPVPAGESVLIPHSLIYISKPRTKAGSSPAFTESTGVWNESLTVPSNVFLRFHLPAAVVPLQVNSIEVQLQLRAPQLLATLNHMQADSATEIGRWTSPSGTYKQTVTLPAVLADAEDGFVDLRLDISQIEKTEMGNYEFTNTTTWQVDYLRLNVKGVAKQRINVNQ